MARDAMGYELGEVNEAAVAAFVADVPEDITNEQLEQVAARLERMVENHQTTMWNGEKLSLATLAAAAQAVRQLMR